MRSLMTFALSDSRAMAFSSSVRFPLAMSKVSSERSEATDVVSSSPSWLQLVG